MANSDMDQIRRAHASARPKHDNPAWMHTHNDLTAVLTAHDALLTQRDALEAREKVLYEALDKYEWHSHKCAAISEYSADHRNPDISCTCGFDAALATGAQS